MNKAEEMLQISTLARFEQKQKEFPQELYDIIYNRIDEAAKSGDTSVKIELNYRPGMVEDSEYFYNVQKDLIPVRKRLIDEGFKVDTNIYDLFTSLPPYYISVTW